MRIILSFLLITSLTVPVFAQRQNQSGDADKRDSIAAGTSSALQNEGLIRAEEVVNTRVTELASQKLSAHRSRRIYLVTFTLRSGGKLEAIALVDKSPVVEQSGLVVYVVSKVLQPDGVPMPPRR